MRPVSPIRSWYPDLRAVRIALAAGAVAGLVVLAACTDKADNALTAPGKAPAGGPRNATIQDVGFANAAKAIVCIAAGSPAGTYKFTNAQFNAVLGGTGGDGSSTENVVDGTEYTVAVGACQQVLTRSSPDTNFCDGGAYPNFPNCVPIDSYTSVKVTVTTMPAGVTYNHTDCELDQGVKFPKDALNATNDPSNPCDQDNNPSRIYANIAHGMKHTFYFNTPSILEDCFLGYPYASANSRTSADFNESEVLTGFQLIGSALHGWYTDEHAMTLGVDSIYVNNKNPTPDAFYGFGAPNNIAAYQIATMFGNTNSATTAAITGNPIKVGRVGTTSAPVGLYNAIDPAGRPLFPALYITNITGLSDNLAHTDPAIRAGDWQYSSGIGIPNIPTAVYGTWKAAVITVDNTKNPSVTKLVNRADPAKNHKVVGPGLNGAPGVNPPGGAIDNGYSSDVVWSLASLHDNNNAALVPGNRYRAQFIVHDGDQNKDGGDVGQACVNLTR